MRTISIKIKKRSIKCLGELDLYKQTFKIFKIKDRKYERRKPKEIRVENPEDNKSFKSGGLN